MSDFGKRKQVTSRRYTGSSWEEIVKKPRLGVSLTDDFDEKNPFTEGNNADEIELKFDEGKSLFVSKALLSFSSPVFARMFQSEFKEADSCTVKLEGKSYEAFLEMLLCLHPRVQKEIADKPTVKNVFQMAHEYQIPTVLKKAETALVGKIRSLGYHDVPVYFDYPGNPFEMLKFAETYESASLLSAAAERISMLTTDTFTSDSLYKDLHESTKNKILMYRLKRCDDGRRRDDTLDLVY